MTDELYLLGCILRDNDIWYKSNVQRKHFISKEGMALYDALATIFTNGLQPTLPLIYEFAQGLTAATVAQIDDIPTASNWQFYEDKVIKAALKHHLLGLAAEIKESKDDDPLEVIQFIDKRIQEMLTTGSSFKIQSGREFVDLFFGELERRMNLDGKLPGIETGLYGLDGFLQGFQRNRLYYIGAHPSDGKSALMMNFARHCGVVKGIKTGIISLESDTFELFTRLVANETSINSQVISSGMVRHGSLLTKISDALDRISGSGLYFYDEPNIDLSKLESVARRMVAYGCEILFVDYIQLVSYGPDSMPKAERVGEVSKSMKELARRLDIPVVVCSQLNRQSVGRKPQKSDLSESSQLEKDADGVILIWHSEDDGNEESFLVVDKNRDGGTGIVPVYFERKYLRFKQREKKEIETA